MGVAFDLNTPYVSDPSRSWLGQCSLQLDGSLTSCDSTSSSGTHAVIPSPGAIAFAGRQVVVAAQNALYLCSSTLTTCNSNTLSYSPVGVAANASYAYISDTGGGRVQACPITGSGTIGTCATVQSGFMFPVTVSLVGTKLYIVDEIAKSISVCTANATTGTLSACAASALVFRPIGLAVSGTSALIGDDSNNIFACAVSGSGAPSGCTKTVSGIASSFNSWQIAIH